MRADDMIVGETYELSGTRRLKVTVLETPPEIRAQRRVRVRFESGVKAGEITDVPSRSVERPWGRSPAPAKQPRAPRRPTVITLPGPPRVGETVVVADMGDFEWTVREVHDERDEVTVATTMFDRPQVLTVPIDSLRIRVEPARGSAPDLGHLPKVTRVATTAVDPAQEAAERLRPVAPRRELDELMEEILFSEACLRDYDRRLRRVGAGSANERLREEVRRRGYIDFDDIGPNEFGRIRVPRRFDIVLRARPTADDPVWITRLVFREPKGAGRRTQRNKPRRRA